MNFDLEDLFPEDISDETAFYLTEFVEKLSWIIGNRYAKASQRYLDDYRDDCRASASDTTEFLNHKTDVDYPF